MIRFAAAFVAANHAVLDAISAADSTALDLAAGAIEAEIAELEPATAAQRFGDDSASLLARSGPIPTSTSRRSTRSPAPPRSRHLRGGRDAPDRPDIDPTYEPDDPRTLMHTLNESLRSMLGHGAEDWVSRREAMANISGAASPGPSGSAGQPFWYPARNHSAASRSSSGDRSQ